MAAAGPRREATSTPRCCCGPTARWRPRPSSRWSPAWRSPRRWPQLGPPGVEPQLKWPNDVLLGGAKTAGILLEGTGDAAGRAAWVIVGTGVNLVSCPDGLRHPVTCLAREGFPALAPETVLAAYLVRARPLARAVARGRLRRGAPRLARARLRPRRRDPPAPRPAASSPAAGSTSPTAARCWSSRPAAAGARSRPATSSTWTAEPWPHHPCCWRSTWATPTPCSRSTASARRSGNGGSRPCASAPPTSTPQR